MSAAAAAAAVMLVASSSAILADGWREMANMPTGVDANQLNLLRSICSRQRRLRSPPNSLHSRHFPN